MSVLELLLLTVYIDASIEATCCVIYEHSECTRKSGIYTYDKNKVEKWKICKFDFLYPIDVSCFELPYVFEDNMVQTTKCTTVCEWGVGREHVDFIALWKSYENKMRIFVIKLVNYRCLYT